MDHNYDIAHARPSDIGNTNKVGTEGSPSVDRYKAVSVPSRLSAFTSDMI